MKIRKLLHILHRDLGYFITGIVVIYGISGIALNHRKDWNPNHIIIQEEIQLEKSFQNDFDVDKVSAILTQFSHNPVYKKHFMTENGLLKIFVENGMVVYNPATGLSEMELLEKRPVFYHINKLHMAGTRKVWVWVSDAMSVILIFVAISGLFLLKGKNGISGRGLWLTIIGLAIPGFFLLFYVS